MNILATGANGQLGNKIEAESKENRRELSIPLKRKDVIENH